MLREMLAKFGFDVDDTGLKRAQGGVDQIASTLGGLGSALAGGAIIAGAIAFTESLISMGSELGRNAARLQVSTDTLQEWGFAAQMSGVNAEEMSKSLKILTKNIAEASTGGGQAAEFAKFGVKLKDAQGQTRGVSDVMGDLAERFTKIKNPTDRAGAAMAIFGKSGLAMVPLLEKGGEGVKKLFERFHELGGGLSEQFVESAKEASHAQHELGIATLTLKSKIGEALLPFVTMLVTKITDLAIWFRKSSDHTNIFRSGLLAVGGASLITGVKIATGIGARLSALAGPSAGAARGLMSVVRGFGSLLSAGLKLAVIYLLLDDIYTLLTGGDSAIGRFIDGMFGIGTSKKFVQDLKDAWKFLLVKLDEYMPTLTAMKEETVRFLKDMFNGFNQTGKDIAEAWQILTDNLKKDFEDFFTWISEKLGIVSKDIKNAKGEITGINTFAGAATAQATTGQTGGLGSSVITQNNENNINIGGNVADLPLTIREIKDTLGGTNAANQAALANVVRTGAASKL